MADTIESKQRFLFQEIITKGYDSDDFIKWIEDTYEQGSLRSPGCDLEKWTASKLETAVKDYQATHISIYPKEGMSQESPEKGSPTSMSEKAEMSSLRSMSIPVHNR